MARQWIVKRRCPTWVMIVFYSIVGYAVLFGMIALLEMHGS